MQSAPYPGLSPICLCPGRARRIRCYADGSRFLLESALQIAAIVLERAEGQEVAVLLLSRLDFGVLV